ncbi:MAG: helix-turn-helix transcriptional regulator, partial [Phycisphaeraceae bacterium]
VRVQAGTLYPLLHRLEADGAVRCRWDRAGGRARKWYELTAAGRRRLRDQASQWEQHAATIRQLLEAALPGRPSTSS